MGNETNTKKKKPIWLFIIIGVVVLLFIALLFGDDDSSDSYDDYSYDYNYEDSGASSIGEFPHGTAASLDGNILVVSIFADDNNCSWSSSNASEISGSIFTAVDIASKWIQTNAALYGRMVNFIYDWTQNEDLAYTTSYSGSIPGEMPYDYFRDYIADSIDINGLMTKYEADNVLFLILVNTPSDNTAPSSTYMRQDSSSFIDIELIEWFATESDMVDGPAAMAHEMLHAFGAKDLYYYEGYNMTVDFSMEYLDYVANYRPNDIMTTVYDGYGYNWDHITNDLSEIDAYYVGLTDRPQEADDWDLPYSEYDS